MATNNRSINICLINTLKPTADLPDNNRIGIDHVNSFIWFDSKKDRDDYFALKTVHSQIQNSKVHDFNAVGTFRIGMDMESYYKLDADLLKVNHTQNGIENVYIYNITDVDYTNNGVVEISVEMNVVYTYLLDDVNERNQLQGVVSKSNFKNENYDAAYVNDVAKGIIGDNYAATDFDSSIKNVVKKENYNTDGISWLAVSMRKKPSVIDDSVKKQGSSDFHLSQAFSDEIVMILPFFNESGKSGEFSVDGQTLGVNPQSEVGLIASLLLNGNMQFYPTDSSLIGAINVSFTYAEKLPFTFASLYDINEIGIIPDIPTTYTPDNVIALPSNTKVLTFVIEDKITKKQYTLNFATLTGINKNNISLRRDDIISNADKPAKLFTGFENWENNVIYNKYFLKYYNTLTTLNPLNLFGSNADLYVNSIYLGSTFKKLFVSTDLGTGSNSLIDKISGVKNSDFMIKFNGMAQNGSTTANYLADNMIADLDTNRSILNSSLMAGGAALGSVVPGLGTLVGGAIGGSIGNAAGRLLSNSQSKEISNISRMKSEFDQQGGSSGYSSIESNTSPMFSDVEEYIPKIIFERHGNAAQIDQQTNYFGTSCSIFTNNLKIFVKDVINNRKNHKCFIQGDFRANRLYPQANEAIRAKLGQGIMLMIKISMQAELDWYRNEIKGKELNNNEPTKL